MAEVAAGRRSAAPLTREGFLASHFGALQGLRTVVMFGVPIAFFVFDDLVSHGQRRMHPGEVAALLALGLLVELAGLLIVPRWYRAKYGFVAGPYWLQLNKGAFKWIFRALVLLYLGCLISCTGDQLFPMLTYGLMGAGLALQSMFPVCEKLPPVASIESRRWFYVWVLIGSAMPIVLARMTHGVSALALLPTCVAWTAAGFYDHWLLGHLARARGPEVTDAA